MLKEQTIDIQAFPKFEAFLLENDPRNGPFLGQLVLDSKEDVICLFLNPKADSISEAEPKVIGTVSAKRVDEIVGRYPEFATEYYDVALCIWKPAISTVHIFLSTNLPWCLIPNRGEGRVTIEALKAYSPLTKVVVCTASAIMNSEYNLHDELLIKIGTILVRGAWNGKQETSYSDGW